MKKNLTELVMILDRSGSMGGLESDTIGGYNSMLRKQKDTEGEVLVSTVLFDDRSEVLYDRVPLDKLPQMTDRYEIAHWLQFSPVTLMRWSLKPRSISAVPSALTMSSSSL